jgi:hypothetical protein
MSCGVKYQFSLVATPKVAKLVREDIEVLGTPEDALEQGAPDPRRTEGATDDLLPSDVARGRRARER